MSPAAKNARNPVYKMADKWLQDQGSTMNIFECTEDEAFYFAMQKDFPGLSMEVTDCFLNMARKLFKRK